MHKYNLNFPISRTIFTYFRPICRNRLLKNFSNGDRNIPQNEIYLCHLVETLHLIFFFSPLFIYFSL